MRWYVCSSRLTFSCQLLRKPLETKGPGSHFSRHVPRLVRPHQRQRPESYLLISKNWLQRFLIPSPAVGGFRAFRTAPESEPQVGEGILK